MKKKYIYLCITLFLVIAAASLIFSATWRDKYDANGNYSIDIMDKISFAQKEGTDIELSSDDLNSISNLYFKNGRSYNGFTLQGVNFNIANDKILTIIYVNYNKLKLQVSTLGSASFNESDNSVSYIPEWFKLGKLYLPKNIVLNKLSAVSNKIHTENNTINISKDILPLSISKIILKDNMITIGFKKFESAAANKQALDLVQKRITELVQDSTDINSKKQLESLVDKVEDIKNSSPDVTSKALSEVESKLLDISASSSNKQPEKIDEVIKEVNDAKSTIISPPELSPVSVGPKDSLIKVSGQLSSAISSLGSSKERQVLQNIQASINSTISDPNHNYKSDVSSVKSLYNSLSSQQKKNVKEAIISNVDAALAFKLRSIYGL